jgi:hypothetical protein
LGGSLDDRVPSGWKLYQGSESLPSELKIRLNV